MRWLFVAVILLGLAVLPAAAQTETPIPTPTATATPEPYVYSTVIPADGTPPGQMTRFDYVATAGDVQIANSSDDRRNQPMGAVSLCSDISVGVVEAEKMSEVIVGLLGPVVVIAAVFIVASTVAFAFVGAVDVIRNVFNV